MTSAHKPWWDTWANSWPEEKSGYIASANTDTQLMLIPCFPPLNGRATLLRYFFSNSGGTAGYVRLWDAYLGDPTGFTTAGIQGNDTATGALWQINLPASSDVQADCNTEKRFQCGIAAQSTVANTFYSIQVAITALG